MEKSLSKYFMGYINSKKMNTDEWFDVWYNTAKKVEEEDCELIIFKLPKNKDGVTSKELISQIEKILQENKKIN